MVLRYGITKALIDKSYCLRLWATSTENKFLVEAWLESTPALCLLCLNALLPCSMQHNSPHLMLPLWSWPWWLPEPWAESTFIVLSYQTHGILTREHIVKSRINAAIPYTKNAQWPSVCHFASYMYAEFRLLFPRHREYDPWFPARSHSFSNKNERPCHELGKKITELQASVCTGEKGANRSQKDESASRNSHSGR